MSYVDPRAELAEDVEVGPFCFVEANVSIGARTKLDAQVTIKSGTTLGEDNIVAHGAVLGGDPQDRKFNSSESTFLKIGDRNVLREYVTVHRATGDGMATVIGNDNYLMAYCHLGHNVTVRNFVTIANTVGISGHVTIEEYATIGGMAGIHQFTRVGKVAMVGGMSGIGRDVPPFMIVRGFDNEVYDINAVGLRRIGVTPPVRLALHKACKLLYKSQLGLGHAIEIVQREVLMCPEVQYLLDFEEHRASGRNGRGDQR